MKAVCWRGKHEVRVEEVPDPELLLPTDAIVRVTSTAICGDDLHLYNGFVPTMRRGDIIGHEFMGEVVEVGRDVTNLTAGDRVLVPCPIACGKCPYCRSEQFSLCDNSNPNAHMAEKLFGFSPAAVFGYSHMLGGYAGGQAEYVRVPYADVGPVKVEADVSDDEVLLLTDVLPTGYMAAESCGIRPGDVIAVWGCGPVGQLAIDCAFMLGAERVIAIDRFEKRLGLAKQVGAEPLDYESVDVVEALRELTGGRGPDACIDAVGLEAHGHGPGAAYDQFAQRFHVVGARATALREAIQTCRKGGTVSLAGTYGGSVDRIPLGAAFGKALTLKMGPTPVHRYMRKLLGDVLEGRLRPARIITHHMDLDQASHAYAMFQNKQDECAKIVLRPTR